MGQSWSGLRKQLEEDFLCESLRGRVQYFFTHYHKAPDKYGRICVRVDGKEIIHGNPYNWYVRGYYNKQIELRDELAIPKIQYSDGKFIYAKENEKVEEIVKCQADIDGVFDIYDFTNAINEYKNSRIEESLKSSNVLIRMLAVMDRRVGKRTLIKLKNEVTKQPEWLQYFYRLRLDAEGI